MTRRTRRLIFLGALAAFFIVSYIVLFYAQGYRYNFSSGTFIRTGAIYLKANNDGEVLLNGVAKTSTSFIGDSASIAGLLPGKYTVSLQQKGYSSWTKTVTVQEGYVQDFGHVMILPNTDGDKEAVEQEIETVLYPPTPSPTPKPTPSPVPTPDVTAPYYIQSGALYVQPTKPDITVPTRLATGIKTVIPSNDGKKIAWFSGSQLWVYWLSDTDYQPYHTAGDLVVLAHFNAPIKAATWFRDSDHIAVDAGGLKVIELDTRGGTNIINF